MAVEAGTKKPMGWVVWGAMMAIAATMYAQESTAPPEPAQGVNGAPAQAASAAKDLKAMSREELTATIEKLDAELFNAYNTCDLETFGSFFPEHLEFYHDQTGGGPMTRAQLVAAIKQNICGKVHRELVKGTIEVYPMKGYGAVELGTHRFSHPGIDDDEGDAKFIQLWKYEDGRWLLTRVISYDHHEGRNR